jgi:hypothetical protein
MESHYAFRGTLATRPVLNSHVRNATVAEFWVVPDKDVSLPDVLTPVEGQSRVCVIAWDENAELITSKDLWKGDRIEFTGKIVTTSHRNGPFTKLRVIRCTYLPDKSGVSAKQRREMVRKGYREQLGAASSLEEILAVQDGWVPVRAPAPPPSQGLPVEGFDFDESWYR